MFHNARIKLTAWYLLIIMVISSAFSIVIYKAATIELDRFSAMQRMRLERQLENSGFLNRYRPSSPGELVIIDPAIVIETKQRLIALLFIINGSILFLSGVLGYFLAGKTLEPIKEMVDGQNQFISDASHDLKTPLTSMRTSLEVSLRDKKMGAKEAQKVLSENLSEVINLQRLSENLLEITRVNNKQSKSKIKLDSIVSDAILEVMPLAKLKKISIVKSGNKNIVLIADGTTLSRALVAVLDNAIKYSNIDGKITITEKIIGNRITLSVRDEGIGIAKKDIPKVTERFYRSDKSRTRNGYGLGLSIAKKTAESHGGKLQIKSKLGVGTTVSFVLPSSA